MAFVAAFGISKAATKAIYALQNVVDAFFSRICVSIRFVGSSWSALTLHGSLINFMVVVHPVASIRGLKRSMSWASGAMAMFLGYIEKPIIYVP